MTIENIYCNKTQESLGRQLLFEGSLFYCIKSVSIRSFSGPYFPAFELNTDKYGELDKQPPNT